MNRLDLSRIPARGLELDLARWSNAFGGSGKGSRKGVERGRLRRDGSRLRCAWEAAFDEFGPIRFQIDADIAVGEHGMSIESSDWHDHQRQARAAGEAAGKDSKPAWTWKVEHGGAQSSITIPLESNALPATVFRFLPLLMDRKEGVGVCFASVPEDAFPWWRPKAKGSFFPLDFEPSVKKLRCTGRDSFKRGKESYEGWAFEQHGKSGREFWWLVSDDGKLIAMSWKKTLWLPEDPGVVRKELGD